MHKTFPLHIRFNDLDAFGHVNNAVYITYFEEGRSRWFQDQIGKNWDWATSGYLLATNEVEYKLPLLFTDEAFIELWISQIGTKSFEVSYRIYKKVKDENILCTTGKSKGVCFNNRTQKSIEIPEEWRRVFEADLDKATA
ncbi:thioesterase family protein [Cryomorphaceae bacterium 1068]|nr:thioesterase family protein [Cryomorphaceae bacterium 1068]